MFSSSTGLTIATIYISDFGGSIFYPLSVFFGIVAGLAIVNIGIYWFINYVIGIKDKNGRRWKKRRDGGWDVS